MSACDWERAKIKLVFGDADRDNNWQKAPRDREHQNTRKYLTRPIWTQNKSPRWSIQKKIILENSKKLEKIDKFYKEGIDSSQYPSSMNS